MVFSARNRLFSLSNRLLHLPQMSSTSMESLVSQLHSRNFNYNRESSRWPLPKYITPGCKSAKRFHRLVGNGNCSEKYNHEIWFNDDGFIVDGKFRLVNHPKNLPFLESLNNCECPEEFSDPGEHCITVYGDLSFDEVAYKLEAKSRNGFKQKFNMGGRLCGRNVSF